jgi:hypothetical protein
MNLSIHAMFHFAIQRMAFFSPQTFKASPAMNSFFDNFFGDLHLVSVMIY